MTYPTWPEGGPDRLETALLETWRNEGVFQAVQALRDQPLAGAALERNF